MGNCRAERPYDRAARGRTLRVRLSFDPWAGDPKIRPLLRAVISDGCLLRGIPGARLLAMGPIAGDELLAGRGALVGRIRCPAWFESRRKQSRTGRRRPDRLLPLAKPTPYRSPLVGRRLSYVMGLGRELFLFRSR